jgi:signal transduction histidine kinase/integral membrane sensor domain MASE1
MTRVNGNSKLFEEMLSTNFFTKNLLVKLGIYLAVILCHFYSAKLGLILSSLDSIASPVWPAAGVAAVFAMYFGPWILPAIFISTNLYLYSIDLPILGSLGFAIGTSLEAYLVSITIKKLIEKNYFNTFTEFFSVIAGGIIGTLVGASLKAFILVLIEVHPWKFYGQACYTFFSGDLVGILMVLPLFMELMKKEGRERTHIKHFFRASVFYAISFYVLYLVFIKGYNQAFAWSLGPIFILTGLVAGQIYSRLLLLILSTYVVYLTYQGYGPFEYGNVTKNLIYVQTLIASYAAAVLFLAPFQEARRIRRRYLAVLFSAWASFFLMIYFVTKSEKHKTLNDFNRTIAVALQSIQENGRRYELLLEGTSSIFNVMPNLNEKDWDIYTDSIRLKSFSDRINSMGVVKIMSPKEAQEFAKRENVNLRIIDPEYSAKQDSHFIIVFNEPFIGTQSTKGWDIGSHALRRVPALRAKEERKIIATDPFHLELDEQKRKSFNLYYPQFDVKNSFQNWVYVSVIYDQFYEHALQGYTHLIRVRIKDNEEIVYEKTDSPDEKFREDGLYKKIDLKLFGKIYRIEVYPTELFFARHTGYSASLALLLNVFMLFITAFLIDQLTLGHKTQKLVEEKTSELEQSRFQLVQSSKMASLGEMASGMAHEINNPLTIIQGKIQVLTHLIEDENIKNPQINEELRKIKFTTDRISKIIKGLRNFSRVSTSDPLEWTRIEKIFQETLDLCSERFKADGINLMIESIPKGFINCRSAEISQVLINLFNNSSDALKNSKNKWIEVSFSITAHRLIIYVTDSGEGIPEDIVEKIMVPFFTTKDVSKGTGLGLSISKGIIEAHGGQLTYHSGHSHTRFSFDLDYSEQG